MIKGQSLFKDIGPLNFIKLKGQCCFIEFFVVEY